MQSNERQYSTIHYDIRQLQYRSAIPIPEPVPIPISIPIPTKTKINTTQRTTTQHNTT